jgi:hypothetical protein
MPGAIVYSFPRSNNGASKSYRKYPRDKRTAPFRMSPPNGPAWRAGGLLDLVDLGKVIVRKVEEIAARAISHVEEWRKKEERANWRRLFEPSKLHQGNSSKSSAKPEWSSGQPTTRSKKSSRSSRLVKSIDERRGSHRHLAGEGVLTDMPITVEPASKITPVRITGVFHVKLIPVPIVI